MKPVYILFEWNHNIKCEKIHESPYKKGSDGKPKRYRCNKLIKCSRTVRFVTTDLDLAVRFTKNKPDWGYQKETLWSSLL